MATTAKRWTGQSQEDRRETRREMLIASATRLYGTLGFRNAGVRAICRDAGLTERYFYESFENGEDLLRASFDRVVAAMLAQIVAADVPSLPADARVRCMLRAYYAGLQANPNAARVFLVEIVGVDASIDRAFEESLLALTVPLLDVYDTDRRGPLSLDPLLRRGVAGGLLHIALAWGNAGYAEPVDRVVGAALMLCNLAAC